MANLTDQFSALSGLSEKAIKPFGNIRKNIKAKCHCHIFSLPETLTDLLYYKTCYSGFVRE